MLGQLQTYVHNTAGRCVLAIEKRQCKVQKLDPSVAHLMATLHRSWYNILLYSLYMLLASILPHVAYPSFRRR